ncbi:MAG TPA: DUF4956 domain-containing protein [Bacteroidales bacterium]|nr:DUF4956 domain-containing protein [Bacteroidales bacterium]
MEKLLMLPGILSLDMEAVSGFLIRFGLNLTTLIILIRVLYFQYRKGGNPEYLFSFILLGIIVFLICTALDMVEVELGFALGLFALFGILRYRTESIPVREMTYMFLVIGIAMVNSLVNFGNPVNGILLLNTLVIIPTWILEIFLSKHSMSKQEIVYDNLDDVYLNEKDLIMKLKELTNLEIKKIRVERVDLIRKQANIVIYYKEK